MAFIRTVLPAEAEDELGDLYRLIADSRGGVAAIHQAQSLNPRALKAHLELYKAVVFQRSSLSRLRRERIAVVVSAANGCRYCIAHHGEAARQLGDDPHILEKLARGELPGDLPPADGALLAWAHKAALQPGECGERDVEALRINGFDDRAVLDAVLTVGYFSFVNRLVLLLGVQVEEGFEKTCRPD